MKIRPAFVLVTFVHPVSAFVLVDGRCSTNVACCRMTAIQTKLDQKNFC